VVIYDTTLRDGTQREGISLSVEDKLKIACLLDELGVRYVEGGWPGSNPKDAELFRRSRSRQWQNATLVAFGSTRRANTQPQDDGNLRALLVAETAAVAVVGKSSVLHVTRVLETSLDENLAMIADSIAWLKRHGREVVYDAEHFFDGYRADPAYALRTLRAAAEAGADWLVLCDTNGGSVPAWVTDVVSAVRQELPTPLGIHTHNDGELAVANALAAVEAGVRQVQGTVNGYGERCGNANLISVVPNLQLKMGYRCVADEQLRRLTELSRTVSELANLSPDPHAPYVGASAFAHKGGLHVAAIEKVTASYEHVPPERVGNQRRVVVSELSGGGNVRLRAAELGLSVDGNERVLAAKIKELESRGLQFEAAEGSFELLVRRSKPDYRAPFELMEIAASSSQRDEGPMLAFAAVLVRVGQEQIRGSAEGVGPVHALDRALRRALEPFYPAIANVRLADYKVRIVDPHATTGASIRVLLEAADDEQRWSTVGCSANVIEASAQALADSLELYLLREQPFESKATPAAGLGARGPAAELPAVPLSAAPSGR
jgi:2-isopropylmalate synthase